MAESIKIRAAENDRNPKGYKIVEADWEYKSFAGGLYSNYIFKSTFEKKDGTESRPKNEHVAIFYSYCPFCGKKYGE